MTTPEAGAPAGAANEEQKPAGAAPAAGAPNPDDLQLVDPAQQALPEVNVETGDPALDIALNFFVKAGVKLDDPVLKAASESGDFSLLEAKLATMDPSKARGWEKHVELAKGVHSKLAEAEKAKVAATTKLIHDAVGGEKAWADIKAWAAANAEPAERESVNAALKAGGLQAKAMAAYMRDTFLRKTGAPKDPTASVSTPGAKPGAGQGEYALSPRAYTAAVEELAQKIGKNRVDTSPEYKQLQARRRAWRPR